MKINFIYRAFLLLLLGSVSIVAQTSLPALRITTSNGVSTVFWPLTAYEGILQTTTDLSPAGTWTDLATGEQIVSLFRYSANSGPPAYTANIIGEEIAFDLPTTNRQQFFRLKTPFIIPVCCFAIFYNGRLEFSQSADMVMNGRVHANGSIYVGTSASQTFNAPVTTTSNLTAPFMDGLTSGWTPSDPNAWNADFNGTPGYITNAAYVGFPFPYSTNYHFLIDIPPANENPTSNIAMVRLYNQAQMVLIVTNTPNATNPTVQLTIQSSYNLQVPGADPSPIILHYTNASPALVRTNLPFLSLTNMFYDQRERKTNFVTQIDVGRFSTWVRTNVNVQNKLPFVSGLYPAIFYVADRRNVSPTQLTVVRLINGDQLPGGDFLGYGFTIATPNPLYIWGNYNVTSSSGTATGTNNAYEVPAALLSDALTVLSPNWADSDGYLTYNNTSSAFDAADTTINAAIITGTVPSSGTSGTTYSGGVHNLPRLLEDWSSKNLYLNTSIVRLWDSQMATNQFRNPQGFSPPPVNPYYNPPTRHFSFDPNFLNPSKIPPGVPIFEVVP